MIRRPLLAPAGWGGVVGRVVSSRLITYDLTSFFSFLLLKSYTPDSSSSAEAAKVATIWPTIRNPPGKDIEVVDALSTLSTESHETIPETKVQTHVVFPSPCNKMLQKIKKQSNLKAKLGALKEMISEGWLNHIQQHPTLLKPNWPFRDQIASEDGIFTKAHRIIIPTTLQKYIFAKLHRPHKVTRRIRLRARTSTGDGLYDDIEDSTKACSSCEKHQYSQQKELRITTEIPQGMAYHWNWSFHSRYNSSFLCSNDQN